MNIPEKMKLNKFQLVKLPRCREMFARFGQVNSPEGSYSGEEDLPLSGRKSDILADMAERDRVLQREEEAKHD